MSRLQDLIELAREPSSERRRELLREITDMFLSCTPAQLDDGHLAAFDDVMGAIASEMEQAVRAELSLRLAPLRTAPPRLLRRLARDDLAVAEPVLRQSPALNDSDLVELADTDSQGRLRAITQRASLSAEVADAIIAHAADITLRELLRNEGAELSREASETAIDRAQVNPELHAAVVERSSLPPDLLNEMYFVVEARLRLKIMERNASLDLKALEKALEAGRNRVAAKDGMVPSELPEMQAEIQLLASRGQLTPTVLTAYLRQGERDHFTVALSHMAGIDFVTARRILDSRDVDPLAIICKAAGFDRTLFLTFVVLMLDEEADGLGRAQEYGLLYSQLTSEAASRAIRFWRMRRQSPTLAAA